MITVKTSKVDRRRIMFKLIKYLKKFKAPIAAIIILLIIQSICDLSLPDYTAKIVNVGIQQGGIEDAVPSVIRSSELDKVTLFMEESDKEKMLESYDLLDKTTASSEDLDKYPKLSEESIYKLKDIDKETREEINTIVAQPMLITSGLQGDNKLMGGMREKILSNIPKEIVEKANGDVFEAIKIVPKEESKKNIDGINNMFQSMPDSMIKQGATTFVKAEYDAIGMNIDKIQSNYIVIAGAKMIGLAFVSLIATIIVGFIAAKVAASLGRNLRGGVFNKVMNFSNTEMDKFSTASLITRTTNDIQQIQMLMVMLLRIVFYAPILAIGGIIKVINTNTSMSWIIAVAVGAVLSLVLVLFAVVLPKFKLVQKLVDKLNLVTREILTGLSVIRAFNTEKYEEERFDKANADLTKTNLFVNRVMSCMMPFMMFIMNGIGVLIVWNGAYSINDGSMQVGDMMAFIQYTMMIIIAFLMISMVSIMLPRATVSAVRVDEILTTDLTILDPKETVEFNNDKKGILQFRNVSFRYPNAEEDVLSNISFTAKPGRTTAFIGSTGSGKSTLVNLIPRLFDVTEGEILLDGVDIRKVTQYNLRDKIGYVPQKGVLFSGTIESNLKYGKENATEEEIERAARIAQATEFISAKEEGFKSEISQGGTNVSGGQKQRLSIARAIAKKPELYIFDDSFSALDYKTDAVLRQALKDETGESTVLIVAQRISTILHAEQIIVLDEGKVVGSGTHRELLQTCEVYNQIASSQLSKEELDHE
jgi:ATP-binding cassette subfamily B protein